MGTVTKETGFVRYAVIRDKNPREVVMLRGSGCKWRRCRFCDYHLDHSRDEEANWRLNRRVLSLVQGTYGKLGVIDSGSFCDLDERTIRAIIDTCHEKGIGEMHTEVHWIHRDLVAPFKERFRQEGITVVMKMGVETFDILFRESYLDKGMGRATPEDIAQYADEINLLQGIPGQTVESMCRDIDLGLRYFQRVCVNIMTPNSAPIQPDPRVIDRFKEQVLPRYRDDPRVDILLDNTAWDLGKPLPEGEIGA